MSSHSVVERPSSDAAPRRRGGVRSTPSSALGGEPRVSLLPSEVNDLNRARSVRRRLIGATVGVLVLVVVAVGGVIVLSTLSATALDSARLTSQGLLEREAEFTELRTIKQQIALIEAGQIVGASTEIEWKGYLVKLQATLPAGVVINSVTIDSASPFADYGQSSAPLQGSRVATLSFAAISPTIPDIPDWLDGLGTLVGFVDAVPDSVSLQPDGTYQVNMTMHINSDAYSNRFPQEGQ